MDLHIFPKLFSCAWSISGFEIKSMRSSGDCVVQKIKSFYECHKFVLTMNTNIDVEYSASEVLKILNYSGNFGADHLFKISMKFFIMFKSPNLSYSRGKRSFNVFSISAIDMTVSPCFSK